MADTVVLHIDAVAFIDIHIHGHAKHGIAGTCKFNIALGFASLDETESGDGGFRRKVEDIAFIRYSLLIVTFFRSFGEN
ncbi:hypothetical protein SAMN05720781_1506 [Fibrobacter sp. UWT3]|nr:hypothetical protein [Fibrobacter sp. UWT3]SOE75248.1 hypothetical protein SAMN05720781_1506 [Fibrobacter sp. UWT3]